MNVALVLREETRTEHVRTEAVFAAFDLATLPGYLAFLTAQASAFLAVEQSLDAAGASAILDDWPARRRGDLLRADLDELGASKAKLQPATSFPTAPAIFGGIYVLEGSRLGGKVLRKLVPDHAPIRFMSADGEPGAWRNFLLSLNHRLSSSSDVDSAVAAARAVFGCFETAGREKLELCVER